MGRKKTAAETIRVVMPWEAVCMNLAQGAINIAEGHTTIEAGSPVHHALEDFCHYVNKATAHPGEGIFITTEAA